MRTLLPRAGAALVLALIAWAPRAAAQAAPPANEIRIGMSTALSGPTSALGRGMKRGVEAYFNEVNAAGGVGGKRLRLVALDDAYQPGPVEGNMRRLIDEFGVLAVVGNVGTPTAGAALPIADAKHTLFFGAFTGAALLRQNPPDRYVVNLRTGYEEETAEMVRGLLRRGIRPQEIAFFTQNDAFGDSGYEGGVRALRAAGFDRTAQLAHGRYERNTLDVEEGLITVYEARVRPRAVIMVGTYAPCAKFIRLARQVLPETLFLNVSFVGSDALATELGPAGEGVIITQVVPHFGANLPGVAAYRDALRRSFPGAAPDFVSLEGYLAAKTFVAGLRRAGPGASRESVIDGIEGLRNLDIGIGVPITYGRADHEGIDRVWATEIRGGKVVSIQW
jgi:ABC-type branched-subunit amino acid transport system substrate-binding protein